MKSIFKMLAVTIIVIFCMMSCLIILKQFNINGGWITKLIPFAAMILVALFFLKVVDKKNIADIGLIFPKGTILPCIVLTIIALIPVMIGALNDGKVCMSKNIDMSLTVLIGYYFIVGFAEEFFVRGYIYHGITISKLKVVLSSAIFAMFHIISSEINAFLLITLFIAGVIFALSYKFLNSLWPLIIFHTIWDIGAAYTDYYQNIILCMIMYLLMLLTSYVIYKFSARGQKVIDA